MKYKADIIIKLKDGIRDTQGAAIETVLNRTGYDEDSVVHAGKFFSICINAKNDNEANEKIEKISLEVLSNPVLESYQILKVEKL